MTSPDVVLFRVHAPHTFLRSTHVSTCTVQYTTWTRWSYLISARMYRPHKHTVRNSLFSSTQVISVFNIGFSMHFPQL